MVHTIAPITTGRCQRIARSSRRGAPVIVGVIKAHQMAPITCPHAVGLFGVGGHDVWSSIVKTVEHPAIAMCRATLGKRTWLEHVHRRHHCNAQSNIRKAHSIGACASVAPPQCVEQHWKQHNTRALQILDGEWVRRSETTITQRTRHNQQCTDHSVTSNGQHQQPY